MTYDTTASALQIGRGFRCNPHVCDQAMPWDGWKVVKNRSTRLGGQRVEIDCTDGTRYDLAAGHRVEVKR